MLSDERWWKSILDTVLMSTGSIGVMHSLNWIQVRLSLCRSRTQVDSWSNLHWPSASVRKTRYFEPFLVRKYQQSFVQLKGLRSHHICCWQAEMQLCM